VLAMRDNTAPPFDLNKTQDPILELQNGVAFTAKILCSFKIPITIQKLFS
jgi:hypothetical protein